ncbi:tetratricopeptide repeat protein [Maribellus sediminis]|uniref:tetratricopeptide repeat protein n=1 Tax=Maribellus sediminis TaxID=2696285 RepID=UPI0014303D53|nr:tetratricopeptide repeat protein [Maribellus sediminis]
MISLLTKPFNFSAKSIFWTLSLILLFMMFLMSLNSGNSGDEHFQVDQAERVYNYFQTFGKDSSAVHPPVDLQKYYGQSFDNVAFVINKCFNIDNFYQTNHILNAATGWLLFLFTALTASIIFGWQAGILTLLLMFFSPVLLGNSWNNPKDIPFAFSYSMALYFLVRFIQELPHKRVWTILLLTVSIAISISIRIGGLIIIPYIFMFTGLYFLLQKSFYSKKGLIQAIKTLPILLIISVVGYFLGLIFWPYAIENPLKNPIESLSQMTNFQVGLNQLFDGEIIMSKNIPWYYGLKYLLIKSPLIIAIGILMFLITVPFRKNLKNKFLLYFLIFFAFGFPIGYTIYKDSNLYGGIRHLLWTLGPATILAAGGFEFFISKQKKYIPYAAGVIASILLLKPAIHTFKNHPYQYVYYNQLVGGTKGAYGKYEMDYYYHSLREGAEWIIENELPNYDTLTVTTNHRRITSYYFRNYPQVKVIYSRYYEKSKDDWDYAIWANEHITPYQLEKGYWPPKETIHTMDVDGKPIGAVVKRISHEDFEGFEALNKRRLPEAKQHFRNFLKLYPENEEVLEGYARIFLMERNLDSTIIYADKSIEYNPRQLGAWLLKASALNSKKDYQAALAASDNMIEIKDDFAEGHYQKGYALNQLNKPNDALKELQKAISFKNDYYQSYYLMGEILSNYKNYKKAIEIYSKVLDKRKDDFVATVNIARNQYLSGNENNATEILERIPANRQNRIEVVALKCRMALDKNDLNTASYYLNMARNINNNADLNVLRGRFLLTQNNRQGAENFLKQAVEIDPTNREAQEISKSLQAAAKAVKPNAPKEEPQSIMFQKPKAKKVNPLALPAK